MVEQASNPVNIDGEYQARCMTYRQCRKIIVTF